MTDLMTRLRAANPVVESERTPIGDVWRKVAAPEDGREAHRGRRRWTAGAVPGAGRAGRTIVAITVIAIPVILVAAIALTTLGAGHHPSQPVAPAAGRAPAHSTLDPRAQRVAVTQLAGRVGTVVALDPRTGAILALVTSGLGVNRIGALRGSVFQYTPGATFDIVTATAALDSGRYTVQTQIPAPAALGVSGVTVRNASGSGYGHVTLSDALRFSVDTAIAGVGAGLGCDTMTTYMRRFGFYTSPRIVSGRPEVPPSGAVLGGRFVTPLQPGVRLGPLAVGRAELLATPLQMAMVASAVAGDGTLMTPHLDHRAPSVQGRVMTPATARAVTAMLRGVVTSGTGAPAELRGAQVAGMTATVPLSTRRDGLTDVWFVGFAPADHPTVAVAVALELTHGGFGGTTAGPIAARVIGSLLGSTGGARTGG